MKIIKISTELEMTIHDFPEGTMREQSNALYELIGNGCPILGNILFSGEKMGNSGVDFCGISEENFDRLKKGPVNMFPAIKVTEVKE